MSAPELITDHLDLWTGAVTSKSTAGRGRNGKVELTGIKKLRELILELAVRGKLVEQDPSDEPASVLLERIAEEKSRLVKEGRIKKPKKLPEISEEEKPFGLPEGWLWVHMEAISEYIQRGKGPKYADSGKVLVVSQKCVQWSGFDLSASRFVDDSSLSGYQNERYIRNGDILWNSTGTGTVGRANVVENIQRSIVADSHVTIIRPLAAEPAHILNYISSPSVQQRIEPDHENSLVSGTTKQVELNSGSVKLLAVPLPPLDEQHRIIEKVDELMALCDRLEQQVGDQLEAHEVLVDTLLEALTHSANAAEVAGNWARIAEHFDTLFNTEASIDKLKQAILQLAVMGRLVPQDPHDEPASVLLEKIADEKLRLAKEGTIRKPKKLATPSESDKPFSLPNGWQWVSIASTGITSTGKTPSTKDKSFFDGDIPFIGPGQITISGQIYQSEKFLSEAGILESEEALFGDIVVVCIGGSIGKCAQVCERCGFNQQINKVRPILVLSDYLLSALSTSFIQERILEKATGSATPIINRSKWELLCIPLPPLNEQHRIVKKVDELMALCDQLKGRLGEASKTRTHLAEAVVEQAVS